jgi:cobalt-zinc-cadmium efflux system protein
VVIAVFILFEAYRRFINPHPIGQPGLFLTVAFIGLVGNVLSIWLLHSEKGKSLNMRTAFLHMAYDALSSVAVIAGGIVIILTGWLTIDVLLSTVIALMIFWSSWAVIKEAVLILMEAVPPGVSFDEVAHAIVKVDGVKDLHDLHIWSLSSNEVALSCHVCVEQTDFNSGPRITAEINRLLAEEFDIGHGTVQLEVEKCMRGDLLCCNSEDIEPKQE